MFTKLAMAIGAAAAVTACSGAAASRTSAPGAVSATLTAATVPASRTITATGQGRARGTPDLLTATLGVQTSGPDARTVLTTNSREAAALIGRLQADGVAAADIKTVQLSLSPQYSDPAPRVTGYAATDTVSVSIHRLDRAGTILDDAAAAGGSDTVIQSLSYSVADEGPLLADGGATLLDVQWRTPHLARLGVVEIPRAEYLSRLADAVSRPLPAVFDQAMS